MTILASQEVLPVLRRTMHHWEGGVSPTACRTAVDTSARVTKQFTEVTCRLCRRSLRNFRDKPRRWADFAALLEAERAPTTSNRSK